MYCGKEAVCEMFCKHWMGDDMQIMFYMCHKL